MSHEKFVIKTMKWLVEHFLTEVSSEQFHLAERLVKKYYRILNTRGKESAISFCKVRRNSILQWLTTIDNLTKSSRSSSRTVLPRDLRFLKQKENVNLPFIRLLLTVFYLSRGLRLPVKPNYESITKEPTYSSITKFYDHIPEFWKTLGYHSRKNAPRRIRFSKYHFTTKTGPNGQALWTSIADLSVLPESLIDSIRSIGGEKLFSKMSILLKHIVLLVSHFKTEGTHFRKVVCIPDREGKTREVAIMDYWSQTALRGFHQYLFKALKKIPQDCTFHQGGFTDKLNLCKDSNKFYSVDLSTATDRFPIELIKKVIEFPVGKDFANSWQNLMVGYPFYYPETNEFIHYSTGNPMGAYSSWNSFAISHHYVLFYCCKELGINWKEAPYILLGDDIVIKNDILAQKYMEVISELGLEFSLTKSHISYHCFEFAKRFFYNGQEITPFPIDALLSTRKTPSLMFNVINDESSKNWNSPLGTPAVSSELYRALGFNSTFVAKKLEDFFITYHIMIALRGWITAGQCYYIILGYLCPEKLNIMIKMDDTDFYEVVGESMFMKMFGDSLVKSFTDLRKGKKPLGLIAEQLVILLTGHEDTALDAFELIPSIPVCHVHGQVEETWLSVVKGDFQRTRTALNKDWKNMLRTMTIPVSDEVYVSRNHEVLVKSSFKFGRSLKSFTKEWSSMRDLMRVISEGVPIQPLL